MSESTLFKLKFWGTRGSIPCPGPDTVKYGGNTTCFEITCGSKRVLIDAGTGIRMLGKKIMIEEENFLDADLFFTHTHMDHSPAAAPLKQRWQAKTYGFGPHGAGKIAEGKPIEEGGDMDFVPDQTVVDGDRIAGDGWTVECVYTPGHTSNHMCFALLEENALFTGDHVLGWSTSVIGPPDGDMTAYLASLEKL